jgi:hypothetical protein
LEGHHWLQEPGFLREKIAQLKEEQQKVQHKIRGPGRMKMRQLKLCGS